VGGFKTHIMKILIRLLGSPFLLCIILIAYNYHAIRHFLLTIKYGGEWITYRQDERKTIQDLYNEIKNQREEL